MQLNFAKLPAILILHIFSKLTDTLTLISILFGYKNLVSITKNVSITKMMWTSLLLILAGTSAVTARNVTVELPTVTLIDCQEMESLKGFDKCLSIKFSYLEEYAGLNMVDRSSKVLAGKLYATDGTCNNDSRVSVSIDMNLYFVRHFSRHLLIFEIF